jgi:hypothetical protein
MLLRYCDFAALAGCGALVAEKSVDNLLTARTMEAYISR